MAAHLAKMGREDLLAMVIELQADKVSLMFVSLIRLAMTLALQAALIKQNEQLSESRSGYDILIESLETQVLVRSICSIQAWRSSLLHTT
jgi:hypothetical protein